jgi:hypothetical protein
LLAEISASENDMDEADYQLYEALKIVENAQTPLAAWRTYHVAEKLCHLWNKETSVKEYRVKKMDAIKQLFDSLAVTDPLRHHFRNLGETAPLVTAYGYTYSAP